MNAFYFPYPSFSLILHVVVIKKFLQVWKRGVIFVAIQQVHFDDIIDFFLDLVIVILTRMKQH